MAGVDNSQYLQWVLPEATGLDALKLENATPGRLGDKEVAVELHAASLNYRELVIVKVDRPPTQLEVKSRLTL